MKLIKSLSIRFKNVFAGVLFVLIKRVWSFNQWEIIIITFCNIVMPKIFEYLGIIIMFYSNEHEPIHIHGQRGEYESKAEFYIENGEIIEKKSKM